MTTALEALGMIGDGETAALVSRAGSIEWMCLPRFDSPACCAALLGTEQHGYWSIAPRAPIERSEQRYQTDTMILETVMRCAEGAIRVTDLMPIRSGHPCVIRMVTGLAGSVTTRLNASFRFDYGKVAPWVTRSDDGIVMHVGPDKVLLSGEADFELQEGSATCEFRVDKDDPRIRCSKGLTLRKRWSKRSTTGGSGLAAARDMERVSTLNSSGGHC